MNCTVKQKVIVEQLSLVHLIPGGFGCECVPEAGIMIFCYSR